jgi:hypothetical protein
MLGVGAIQRTKVQEAEKVRCYKISMLAAERFDDLFNHAIKCSQENCSECEEWGKICEVLLRVWHS